MSLGPTPDPRDIDVERSLEAYFRETWELAGADSVAERAILEAAITPQHRPHGLLHSFAQQPPALRTVLATVSIVLAVIGGFGMWRLVESAATPRPSPTPTASASPTIAPTPDAEADSGWRTVTFVDLGFALDFPAAWTYTALPDGVRIISPEGERFRVERGNPDGTIDVCVHGACEPHAAGNRDELAAVAAANYRARWDLTAEHVAVEVRDTKIDSEPAVVVLVGPRRPFLTPGTTTYVGVIHESRVYFLVSDPAVGRFSRNLNRLLDGFRFFEPAFYTSADGYRVLVRPEWETQELRDSVPCSGLTGFGRHPFTRAVMTVAVGASTGEIAIPRGPGQVDVACLSVAAGSLDGLQAAALAGVDPGGDYMRDLELDGDPARYIGVDPTDWAFAKSGFGYVIAFHEGLPVVIRFEVVAWRVLGGGISVNSLIDSFRWVEGVNSQG
jgi:hypothetical protein